MKKITVVCLTDDRNKTVDRLGELGIVHVMDVNTPSSDELDALQLSRDNSEKVYNILHAHNCETTVESSQKPADVIANVLELLADNIRCEEKVLHWKRVINQLEPWGSFSTETIKNIENHDYKIVLSTCVVGKVPDLPENAIFHEINTHGKTLFFALILPKDCKCDITPITLPIVTNIELATKNLLTVENEIIENDKKISIYANESESVKAYLTQLNDSLNVVHTREGMGKTDQLAFLQGYVPKKDISTLEKEAGVNGWALQYDDPDEKDEKVPTLLKVPKIFKISEPIFSFIGISPGYRETDVSISMLLFLTLFFGMLIGDAGYGIIFAIAAIAGKILVKNPNAKLPLNLFLLLSMVTILWGGLSGNYFGIEGLPESMNGIKWLKNSDNIKWFCFLLAAIHLSLARVWQIFLNINKPRVALANAGWGLFLWGNFFLANELVIGIERPGFSNYLFIVGAALIVLFDIDWKDIGSIINTPFSFIGSFVDTLSYIRLFAVGLASYNIALSFNAMAGESFSSGGFGIIMGVFIVLAGHLLNIILGFMGVLVHGVRLNTLEFSNHMGLTWSGTSFKPFKKNSIIAEDPQE